MEEVLAGAPEDIDTRQGSIFYDAVSGIALKIAELYTDLDLVFTLTQVDTTGGEYLDTKASEYGITRHAATPAKYYVTFTGTSPDVGERFFTNGNYFVLGKTDGDVLYLEAETAGSAMNNIDSGTAAVPVNNIEGLTSATFGTIMQYGTDTEDDESLRQRVREKIGGPAENGNKQHYKTWCEDFDGVQKARIFPLWAGPNTVKAVLINSLGLPCSSETVAAVQTYIDPITKGSTVTVDGTTYTVGDGLGGGVANLGAHFLAVSAAATTINVEFTAELASGYTIADARSAFETAMTTYLKNLVLTAESPSDVVIYPNQVGAIIIGLNAVKDYSSLTLNGDTEEIEPGNDSVPVLGEVTVNAAAT